MAKSQKIRIKFAKKSKKDKDNLHSNKPKKLYDKTLQLFFKT